MYTDEHCEIFVGTIGGRTTRVAPEAMAYSSRDANYVMNVHGRWDSAAEDERCVAWAREFFAKSRPFASGGAYINFLTQDETDRIRFAYGQACDRLVEIKNKYDPANFFRMNQNICTSPGISADGGPRCRCMPGAGDRGTCPDGEASGDAE